MAATIITKQFHNTEIPSDWEKTALCKLANIVTGKVDVNSGDENGMYPFFTCAKEMTYSNNYSFDDEAILISGNGAGVGYCHYYIGKFEAYQRTYVLRGFEKIEVEFLLHYLLFDLKKKILLGKQDAAMPYIKIGFLENFLIPLPPLPEQKVIAQVLSTADIAIQTTVKLIAQKELRKKWLMQHLLTGKKRLKGFSGEWKENKLEFFIKDYKEKPTNEDNYEVLTSAKAGLMKQTDYYGDNRITNRDDADYNVIPPNYLTYRSRSDDGLFTFNKNDLGITGLISGYYPVFTIKNGDINFILMYMNYYRQKLTKYAIGTSQLVLAMNALKEAKFHLPPEEEQTAIAQVLQAADKEISLLKLKAEKLREQKKGLMQQLLTGKVRLKID